MVSEWLKEKLHFDVLSKPLVLEGIIKVGLVIDQSMPLPHNRSVELTSKYRLYSSVDFLVVTLDLEGGEGGEWGCEGSGGVREGRGGEGVSGVCEGSGGVR